MEVIRSIQRFDSIRDEWNTLADRHEQPLLRHEWFRCCARFLHREADLRVVVIRAQGRLVAAAPLVRSWRVSAPRLVFLGAAALHEPCGFLYESRESLEELLREVLGLGVALVLQRLDADSDACDVLPRLVTRPGTQLKRGTAPSLVIPIRTGWQEYYQSLSTRITQNLPRVRTRAEALGPVRVEIRSAAPDAVDGLMDVVMRIEASGWKGRRGTALAVKTRLGEFFREYARAAAQNGLLRVSLLMFGARVAAVEVNLEAYRRIWQLKIGYDEALARYYPGLQLVQETVRDAFERGLEAFEFLGVAEEWEERWNPVPRPYVTALAYPGTPWGLWGLAADAARAGAGRAVRFLQPARSEAAP